MKLNTLQNTRRMTLPRSIVTIVTIVTTLTTPIRNEDYKGMLIMIESLIVGRLLRMIIKTILTLTQTPLIANIYLLKVPLTGQSPILNSCKTLDWFMIMLFTLGYKISLIGGGMGTVWK